MAASQRPNKFHAIHKDENNLGQITIFSLVRVDFFSYTFELLVLANAMNRKHTKMNHTVAQSIFPFINVNNF